MVWVLIVDKVYGIVFDVVKVIVLGILVIGYFYIVLFRVGYYEVIEVVGFCKGKIIVFL